MNLYQRLKAHDLRGAAARLGYRARLLSLVGDHDGATALADEAELLVHPALAAGGGGLQNLPLTIISDRVAAMSVIGDRAPFPGGAAWTVDRDDLGVANNPTDGYVTLPAGLYLAGGYVDFTGAINSAVGTVGCYIVSDTPLSLLNPQGDLGTDAAQYANPAIIQNYITAPTTLFQCADDCNVVFRIDNRTDATLDVSGTCWWFIQVAAS